MVKEEKIDLLARIRNNALRINFSRYANLEGAYLTIKKYHAL